MINVLFSDTRLLVARQKKVHKGCTAKLLGTLPIPGGNQPDYAALAQRLHELLRKSKIKDIDLHIILGEQVVFKEFTHLPVSARVEAEFARVEATTALHEAAAQYSITSMPYGAVKNEAGEVTGMLLAAPVALLKALRAAFGAAGFSVESVHSLFDCYTATIRRVLPAVAPRITGAAIDFGYDYTLISLFYQGSLVSQRRFSGVLSGLAPVVMEDTGCAQAEVAERLSEGKFSPAYPEKARAALTGFTYDVLRTLRVLAAPLHIQPEQFVLTGAACKDKSFLALVKDSLGLPCLVAEEDGAKFAPYLGHSAALSGLFVLCGPLYSDIDLLSDLRQKKRGSLVSAGMCAAVTLVALAGMLLLPGLHVWRSSAVAQAQQTLDALSETQLLLTGLTQAQARLSSIDSKAALLAQYVSNTGDTLPRVLSLFGAPFTLQTVHYDSEAGAYDVVFLSDTKENFFLLKDSIYANESYYLNLSMSVVRQTDSGAYECQMRFVPADYIPLPVPAADAPLDEAAPPMPAQDVSDKTSATDTAAALIPEVK